MSSFKRNENIHKKVDGSYYVVSANKASSISDPVMTRKLKPVETYCNLKLYIFGIIGYIPSFYAKVHLLIFDVVQSQRKVKSGGTAPEADGY